MARGKSPSLDGAVKALERLRKEWSVIFPVLDT
jgi:hypothetical protein